MVDLPSRDLTTDAALDGRLRLMQPRRGHRFGHDAILLAAATPARGAQRVVEFGCGVGAAGLALGLRAEKLHLTLIDIDEDLVGLARANATLNGLEERVTTVALDVAATARDFSKAGLAADSFHHVLMNPPFNDPARLRRSPQAARARAHSADKGLLAAWCRNAGRLLRPKGTLTLIWRADGLAEVLEALPPAFGGIAVLPVHARPDAPAIRILLRATKQSRAPLAIWPGLFLAEADSTPSALANAVLRGKAVLPFAEL